MANTNDSNPGPLSVLSDLTMIPCSICAKPVILIDHRRKMHRFECVFIVLADRAICGCCALDTGMLAVVTGDET
jgi:hypothetical protein